jgi:hypothetical protein
MAPPPPAPPPHGPPTHTDQCLLDYARFGFCEHTTLQPGRAVNLVDSRPLYTPDPRPYASRQPREGGSPPQERDHRARRELIRWVGFSALLISTYLIATNPANNLFDTFLLITLPGIGWLIALTSGLPAPVRILMFTDFGKIIPKGARLDDPAPTRARRRKKKGPSA